MKFKLPCPARCAGLTTALGALALLGACASTPEPTTQMALSTAALAHAVGAGSVEGAPGETALARDKMVRARAAVAAGEHDTARVLAEQAQVDAQLAEARTEAAKAAKSAAALREATRVLREEMARKTP